MDEDLSNLLKPALLPGAREEPEREEGPEPYLQELLRPELRWRWSSSWHLNVRVREHLDSPSVYRSVPTRSWSRTTTAAVQPNSIVPRRDCMVTGIFLRPYPVLHPSLIIVLPIVTTVHRPHSHPLLELTAYWRSQKSGILYSLTTFSFIHQNTVFFL